MYFALKFFFCCMSFSFLSRDKVFLVWVFFFNLYKFRVCDINLGFEVWEVEFCVKVVERESVKIVELFVFWVKV